MALGDDWNYVLQKDGSTLHESLVVEIEPVIGYVRSGQGVQKMECGTKKSAHACPDKHEIKFFMNYCGRQQCPVCFEKQIERIARDVEQRMINLSVLYRQRGIKLGKLKHIVFSPPKDLFSRKDIEYDAAKSLWLVFNKMLKKLAKDGFYGGVAFLHCERGHKGKDWEWSPHVHFLGYGFLDDSEVFFKKTGWVYVILKNRGERNVYTTVSYELNHSALFVDQNGKQRNRTIKWLGIFSTAKAGKRVVEVIDELIFGL
jgi:hypothetical protein